MKRAAGGHFVASERIPLHIPSAGVRGRCGVRGEILRMFALGGESVSTCHLNSRSPPHATCCYCARRPPKSYIKRPRPLTPSKQQSFSGKGQNAKIKWSRKTRPPQSGESDGDGGYQKAGLQRVHRGGSADARAPSRRDAFHFDREEDGHIRAHCHSGKNVTSVDKVESRAGRMAGTTWGMRLIFVLRHSVRQTRVKEGWKR